MLDGGISVSKIVYMRRSCEIVAGDYAGLRGWIVGSRNGVLTIELNLSTPAYVNVPRLYIDVVGSVIDINRLNAVTRRAFGKQELTEVEHLLLLSKLPGTYRDLVVMGGLSVSVVQRATGLDKKQVLTLTQRAIAEYLAACNEYTNKKQAQAEEVTLEEGKCPS
jgi:hypothetical protein